MKQIMAIAMAVLSLSAISCKQQPGQDLLKSEDFQKALQEKFILAKNGDIIELPEGRFLLTKPLLLEGLDDITIKGQGADKTILSFKGQTEGAEGIFVSNMKNITLEDFTVEDALGDNFKFKGCDGVVMRRLNSTWTDGAKETNGAYGYYPVECRNVLIEDCEVSYCSDAGVYVGQSTNVVVRRCYAHHNVAGIEIENCINSDIYDNLSENNTGGILVFDLPKLFQANGRNARVFNNKIINNNHKNFAAPGNIVAIIPPGTGMIILATDSVEIYDNIIEDHKTVGIAVVSYDITEKPVDDPSFGPHCNAIYIRNNSFKNSKKIPDLSTDMGKLLTAAFRKPVDILYDNINYKELYDAAGMLPDENRLCIQHNTGVKTFGNLNGYKAKSVKDLIGMADSDISKFDCTHGYIPGARTPIQ
jgi:parallel beta-helix repeat protein